MKLSLPDPQGLSCFIAATGYHTSLVSCLSKKCRCKPGYKPEGGTCRKCKYITASYLSLDDFF